MSSPLAEAGWAEGWAALLAGPEELIAIRALQRGTFTGRPVGEPAFVARLEEQLGRPLAPRQGQRAPLLAAASSLLKKGYQANSPPAAG